MTSSLGSVCKRLPRTCKALDAKLGLLKAQMIANICSYTILTKPYTLYFRHNAIAHLVDFSIMYAQRLYALGNQKFIDSFYCDLHCAMAVWHPPHFLHGMLGTENR
jgi:hypothetical protein